MAKKETEMTDKELGQAVLAEVLREMINRPGESIERHTAGWESMGQLRKRAAALEVYRWAKGQAIALGIPFTPNGALEPLLESEELGRVIERHSLEMK